MNKNSIIIGIVIVIIMIALYYLIIKNNSENNGLEEFKKLIEFLFNNNLAKSIVS